jgi:hypothetical protein
MTVIACKSAPPTQSVRRASFCVDKGILGCYNDNYVIYGEFRDESTAGLLEFRKGK